MLEAIRFFVFLGRLADAVICSLLVALVGGYMGSFFSWASGLNPDRSLNAFTIEGLCLAFFGVFYLWPVLLFFGVWIVLFTPRKLHEWSVLAGISFLTGFFVSWFFQTNPAWLEIVEIKTDVQLISLTTAICCLVMLGATAGVAGVYSFLQKKGLSLTNFLVSSWA